jgi:hypothetical protein
MAIPSMYDEIIGGSTSGGGSSPSLPSPPSSTPKTNLPSMYDQIIGSGSSPSPAAASPGQSGAPSAPPYVGMGDVQVAGGVIPPYPQQEAAQGNTPWWKRAEDAVAPPPPAQVTAQRAKEDAEAEARQKAMYQSSPTARVLGSYLGGFTNADTRGLVPGAQQDYGTSPSAGEKAASIAGNVLGSLPPIFASEALAGGPLAAAAEKLGISAPALLSAIKGAGTFGGMGLVQHGGKLLEGQETPTQAATGEAGDVLFGGAMGPAEEAVSPLVSKIPGENIFASLARSGLRGAGGFAAGQAAGSIPGIASGQQSLSQAAQGLPSAALQGFLFGMGSGEPGEEPATHQVATKMLSKAFPMQKGAQASDQDQRDAAPDQLQGMPEDKLSSGKKTELTANQMFTDAATGKGDPATRDQILNNYSLEAINIRRKQNGLPPVADKGGISQQQNASAASQAAPGAEQTPAGEEYATPALGADNWKPGTPMVDTSPMNLQVLSNDKTTARDWRQELSSKQNAQVVRGNQVGDAIAKMAPGEDEAITINRELHGDKAEIQKFIDNPDPRMDQLMENSKETYRQAAVKALNLSGNAVQAEGMENQYYDESGNHSKELGTINSILEDYTNHLYKPEKATDFVKTEGRKPGLSTYTSHRKQRVYPSMLHALLGLDEDGNPITDDEGNPIKGKTPATMKSSELLKLHNEDMARVNTNMEFLNAVSDKGMGKWVQGSAPDGWTKIEGMQKETAVGGTGGINTDLIDKYLAARKLDPTKMTTIKKISEVAKLGKNVPNSVRLAIQDIKDDIADKVKKQGENPQIIRHDFAMPDGLAKGIGAAIEPNFIKRVDALRGLQRYQGLVKTVDLSYSAFHHVTMLAQLLYQTKGGFDILANTGKIRAMMKDPGGFNQMEQDFVRHTGMTSNVEANQDILRKMTQGDDLAAKISNWPPFKTFLTGAEKSSDFLFGTIQRYMKVLDYQNKVMSEIKKRPGMTDDELTARKRGVAREINNAYGGLNWRALGVSKSAQSVMRLLFLAPDWTVSNILLAKDAVGGWKGPERASSGGASRASLGIALVGGEMLTQGLNYLITGHFTDQNAKGHEQDVQVQPGVYVSMFRGGPGDVVKLASDVIRYGPQGAAMFTQGKLSPVARVAVGLMSNTDYLGRKIADTTKPWGQNALSAANFILNSAAPIPFGASGTSQYLFGDKGPIEGAKEFLATGQLPNKQATVAGTAAIATSVGRYATPPANTGSVFDQPAKANQGNWLHNLTLSPQERAQQDMMNTITSDKTTEAATLKQLQEDMGKAIAGGDKNLGPVFDKYGIPSVQQGGMAQRKQILNEVLRKLKARQAVPLVSKFNSLPVRDRGKFIISLTAEDRQLLVAALEAVNPAEAKKVEATR